MVEVLVQHAGSQSERVSLTGVSLNVVILLVMRRRPHKDYYYCYGRYYCCFMLAVHLQDSLKNKVPQFQRLTSKASGVVLQGDRVQAFSGLGSELRLPKGLS